MMDSLNRQQNPPEAMDLMVSGKGNSPGTGKGVNKVSPNRVAYVLNQSGAGAGGNANVQYTTQTSNRPAAGGAAVRTAGLEADDKSLHSVGNYSAITDEGFPLSPTPGINAQAPLTKSAPLGTFACVCCYGSSKCGHW
jgi:hypothetical protein